MSVPPQRQEMRLLPGSETIETELLTGEYLQSPVSSSSADSIMLQKSRNVAAALEWHGVTAILRLVNISTLGQDLLPGRCGRFDSNMSMVPII